MSRLRFSVRAKIMGTVVFVAAIVLALGAWTAYHALLESGRGRYLETHFQRFRLDMENSGDGDAAAARLIARDPALIEGLETGEPASIVAAGKRLQANIAATLSPDLLLIGGADGALITEAGTGTVSNWRATRLFRDLLGGKTITGALAVIDGEAYRVSGSAVRRTDASPVVGTVLVAQRLDRFLAAFAKHSHGKTPGKQHRVSLVGPSGVLASALPKADWPGLLAASQAAQCDGATEGRICAKAPTVAEADTQVPVLKVKTGSKVAVYDYWGAPAVGYLGGASDARLGSLLLMRTRSHVAKQMRDAEAQIVGVLGVAAVIALLFGFILSVQITRPLRSYIEATGALARGQADLSQKLPVRTRDELGVLADNLNQVFARIHSLAGDVQRSAFQVGSASGEIATVSNTMLDGSKEQASKISNSTAAVIELSSSIQQVAENAAEASRRAKASGRAVTDAIKRLEEIRGTVEDAAKRIDTLGESGKRIGNIVEVIRQISEQTTMLALNAAIEAAHAGEHGRGFAVVADEVSSLAKRVGQSARDIEDLIAAIRDQTGEAVRVMQSGSKDVEEGTGLVTATLGDLQTLVSVIDDTASAVQEQAVASDEIARNMDVVQRIATEVLSSSENAVEQGDRLHQLAESLERSVGGFKVDKNPPGEPDEVLALPEGER